MPGDTILLKVEETQAALEPVQNELVTRTADIEPVTSFDASTVRPKRIDRDVCSVVLLSDRSSLAEHVGALLRKSGRQAYRFTHCRADQQKFGSGHHQRPDVILFDLSSPDLAYSPIAMRRIPLLAADAPVIVVVGEDAVDKAEKSIRFDAQDFVVETELSRDLLDRSFRYARERFRLLRIHQRTNDRFRRLIMSSQEPAMVLDARGELLYANPALSGLLSTNLKPGDSLMKIGLTVPVPDDSVVTVEDRQMSVRCLRIEWDRRSAWLLQLKDIGIEAQLNELRNRLDQHKKLAVIGQLAAGVAHEIKNPLAFILANLSATLGHVHHVEDIVDAVRNSLSRCEIDEAKTLIDKIRTDIFTEVKESLEDNLDGVDRINTIVHELKNFSRQNNQQHELVRINDVVSSSCKMVSAQIRHRALLQQDLHEVKPVMGHRVKLIQILTNLLMNAAQALPDHRGRQERIEVRTRQDGRWVVVTVSDTGTGIDAEHRGRIFEHFFTTKTQESGTGIGLPLSAELARQHEGILQLVSTSPQGSTFELRLPAVDSFRLVPTQPLVAMASPMGSGGHGHVLIVDDEVNVQKSLTRVLRQYDVTTASTGREAIQLLQSNRFDAVVCDLSMPDLDGVDVHQAVTERWPEMVDRILFTSGGAYTPRMAAFMAKNDVRFLEKPIAPKMLLQVLEQMTEKKEDPS